VKHKLRVKYKSSTVQDQGGRLTSVQTQSRWSKEENEEWKSNGKERQVNRDTSIHKRTTLGLILSQVQVLIHGMSRAGP
jgi:hypothetical protein